MYEERFYRHYSKHRHSLEITYRESDLYIVSDKEIDKKLAQTTLIKYYTQIENYIKKNPKFLSSLSPLEIIDPAPPIVKDMFEASKLAGIGPFSSVAGAVALYTGKSLLKFCNQIMVENGGDIFLKINKDKKIGLYLGENFHPQIITIKIKKRDYPFGICSSSSTIGPSLNFGRADLLSVIGKDAIISDVFATAYSNKIRKEKDINEVINEARSNSFIEAIIISFENKIFFWGNVEIDE